MTNKELHELGQDALRSRTDYEKKLAQFQLQRFGQNRGRTNNYPWPRASNVIYPLSDTLIDQKKPFLFKLLYSSETIAHFKALIAENVPLASMAEKYFDFLIREQTDFEEEIQYAIDGLLQDGECYVKTTWNVDLQVPEFEFIEPMFIITPSGCMRLQDAGWVYHVLQLSPDEVKKRYKDTPDIEKFVKKWSSDDSNVTLNNDMFQRQDNEYFREGINSSGGKDFKQIVLWECHYMKDDKKMIRTISPDDDKFDFKDTREYPYEYPEAYRIRWMIEQGRREFTNKKLHSSRGIPELVQEGEYSLTAMWRAKHNAMTVYNNPVYFAPNGIPGSTQNVTFSPGTILPFQVQALQQGSPPISWDNEMNFTRGVWEKRAATPDFTRTDQQGNNRTAKEVSLIAGQQGLNVEIEAGNWKMFIRRVLRQAWSLTVQYKPKSLTYLQNSEVVELNAQALNSQYTILVSGSAEALNRELDLQKADMLLQRSSNNPFANFGEAWKNFLQAFKPGEVQRFYQDPASRQQQLVKKVASDISLITSLAFPVQPDPMDDQLTVIKTVAQFIQASMQKGVQLTPDALALLGAYVAGARERLAQTNKGGVQEADQIIGQLKAMFSPQPQNVTPLQAQPMAM